jgi:hypothetical protein
MESVWVLHEMTFPALYRYIAGSCSAGGIFSIVDDFWHAERDEAEETGFSYWSSLQYKEYVECTEVELVS